MRSVSEFRKFNRDRHVSNPRRRRDVVPTVEGMEGRALLAPMIANLNGITGTRSGNVWHYQDNGGWYNYNRGNAVQLVDSRDPSGREELFARFSDNSIWTFNYSTAKWSNTGGHLDSMIANVNGVTGTSGGTVLHYQDNGGWINLNQGKIASLVDSFDPKGHEELFARGNDNSIWSYSYLSGKWYNTGRKLDSMIANANGITGTTGGNVWHYQDNGGWSNLNRGSVTALVDSHDPSGREELFAQQTDSSIWTFIYATAQWHSTGGHLDTMIANLNGITGTTSGKAWHYQDNGGWFNLNNSGTVTRMVDSFDAGSHEELFVVLSDGSVWSFAYSTGKWKSVGGPLDQ